MGSVPSKVGVFFGKADKVSEGWYWTDTSIGQKRKAAITGPFETKEKAVENALQSLAARQALNDQPAINGPSSVSSSEGLTRRPFPLRCWTVDRIFALFPRLAERRSHLASQLSGGERQMLAVARALMIDPELILMDEPSEGLAPIMVQHLEGIVGDLKRDGLSILLVKQNLYTALAVADRVYILETGKVVHEATSSAIARDPYSLGKYLGVN
jgi:ABC-type dipeptide/oligopeptide/nickel transport system ATPase subunit